MANVMISMVLSFFIAGLGIAYLGNLTLGIGVVLLWLILCLISLYSTGIISVIVGMLAVMLWAYSLFATFFQSLSR